MYARPNHDDPEFEAKELVRAEYFDPIYDEIDNPKFYNTLFTYFMNYDIKGYRPAKFPLTQARKDIVETNKSPIETLIEEHIDKFIEGISGEQAYVHHRALCERDGYKGVFAKMKFLGELKRWCDNRKGKIKGDRTHKLYLNDAGKVRFRVAIEELNEVMDEDIKLLD
jgi:hypothetical protein